MTPPAGTKYLISEDGKAITCSLCGKTSHNPNDVAHWFCAFCHAFHHPSGAVDYETQPTGRAEPAPLGYSRSGDVVTVRLMRADFEGLLMCIGGAMALNDPLGSIAPRVANAVNAGRPASEWVPYEVPKSE